MKPVAEVSRVVVADDQPAFREAAREVIEETEGLQLVGVAEDCCGLPDLVDSLARVAGDVLIVDVTPDDVADLGVRVVRGIVPGFQPIHFGADQARLGHQRLFTARHL